MAIIIHQLRTLKSICMKKMSVALRKAYLALQMLIFARRKTAHNIEKSFHIMFFLSFPDSLYF